MILVCGEALIDLFVGAAEGAEMPARAVAGGSPVQRRDWPRPAWCDSRSSSAASRAIVSARCWPTSSFARASTIAFWFVPIGCRRSRWSRPTTDGQPSYAFHGEGAADRSLALADLPAELPPDVQALTFGSYTMAVEPVGSALRRARRTRMRTARDQCRSQSAAGRGRRHGALGGGGRALLPDRYHHQGQRRGCARRLGRPCVGRGSSPSTGSIAARGWWW